MNNYFGKIIVDNYFGKIIMDNYFGKIIVDNYVGRITWEKSGMRQIINRIQRPICSKTHFRKNRVPFFSRFGLTLPGSWVCRSI